MGSLSDHVDIWCSFGILIGTHRWVSLRLLQCSDFHKGIDSCLKDDKSNCTYQAAVGKLSWRSLMVFLLSHKHTQFPQRGIHWGQPSIVVTRFDKRLSFHWTRFPWFPFDRFSWFHISSLPAWNPTHSIMAWRTCQCTRSRDYSNPWDWNWKKGSM